ncbi:hypothetical protein GA0070564_101324 [Micromonospora mirobrigensis]|uniref:Uncharacterized protein n=1 Tax=Micromonospora mirobrigensis TaxID=262898 RepID=A0A1C4U9P0_9ACTN|nr:hypothetical protein GA0070564_101324 [Micromonospora mirobrigensis]
MSVSPARSTGPTAAGRGRAEGNAFCAVELMSQTIRRGHDRVMSQTIQLDRESTP